MTSNQCFEIPESWLHIELGDVVDYGKTTKVEPDAIGPETWVLELEDIEKDSSRLIQRCTFSDRKSKSTKNAFNAGDVLYGKLRPYLNKVLFADSDGVCTTEIVPLQGNPAVYGRYLYYWMRNPIFITYVNQVSHGVNMPRLGTDAGKKAPFILAPMPEQKRVADKLDTVIARVDACRERLDRVPAILKRFRQSVLSAATSGSLTAQWRAENHREEDWPQVQLSSVAEEFSYGSSAKSSRTGAVPVLRMGNIQEGQLKWTDLVYTSDPMEIAKYRLKAGDVLFNRTNSPELVGKTAVFNGEHDAIYAGYLIKVRCSDRLLPDYLNYCLNSPAGRDYCWRVKSDGVSQSNINAKKLAAFEFLLPSVREQNEIVRRVRSLFAYADTLESRCAAAYGLVESLTPALLAKAFRGELVPQDPNDEPAAELLKRLANQRSGEGKATKGTRAKRAAPVAPREEEPTSVE
ncbi:restriction endonuclease subunit S [Paraburkholderia diazotrophica]|uniref:Type I restriction enzyme, S subunit n=1 Tax=Paraburkholderia diazotrophica TaxID=667676 RepID=A0A1H7CMW0_9BURK|nr:restriction endonuclease subunit S [Paraburkholderia diazotrophica]SEJ90979.1 type I restriction enzyme, S subunit [Paraburkholderia diazotrophica]